MEVPKKRLKWRKHNILAFRDFQKLSACSAPPHENDLSLKLRSSGSKMFSSEQGKENAMPWVQSFLPARQS
jgi:hypothetical protein